MSRPNVVWITLDSVRSDHTSLDGYRRDTTPTLAGLAKDGVGFPTCITHGKATLPSSGAILTGQAPSRTTVGISGRILPDSVRTVAERFVSAGYRTAALSGNSFVGPDTGLDRGFERYQWLTSSTLHEVGIQTLLGYLMNIRTHSAGLTTDASKHSTPYLMNAIAKRWVLDLEGGNRPFFFYLHYNEPHRPYYPPLSFLDRYTNGLEMTAEEAGETALRIHRNLDKIIAKGTDLTQAEWNALHAMYDAEIAYTDEMIGRLVEWVRRRDLGPTVLIVTADHGDLFGEYGLLSHKFVLHDGLVRVPLVVADLTDEAGIVTNDLVVDPTDQVQHADVMRTLLEVANADTDGLLGVDLREDSRDVAVAQRGPPNYDQIRRHDPGYDTSRFHDGVLTAIRTPEWKYNRSEDRAELHALCDETTDVSLDRPDVVDRLEEWRTSWMGTHGQPVESGESGEFSDAARKQLRDLGYID